MRARNDGGLADLDGRSVLEIRELAQYEALRAVDPFPEASVDVVLLIDVLGRLRDPLGGLRVIHAACRELAVIETGAVALGGVPDACAVTFAEIADGWCWTPTRNGLEGLCRAAGFRRVAHMGALASAPPRGVSEPHRERVHAWR